jgi:hypothetical protein
VLRTRRRTRLGKASSASDRPTSSWPGAAFRQTCLAIVRERSEDFEPTLAAETLAEVHGLPPGTMTGQAAGETVAERLDDPVQAKQQHRRD